MKTEEYSSGSRERRVLAGLVMDDGIARTILSKWHDKEELFLSHAANVIASIVSTYYKKYSKAPGKAIGSLIEAWSEGKPDEQVREIHTALSASLGEWDCDGDINQQYLIAEAIKHINWVKVCKLETYIQGHKDADLDKVFSRINTFTKVDESINAETDLFIDRAAVARVFNKETHESIIPFREGLKEFWQSALCRGGFISFVGRQKIGKTQLLVDMAWRAMKNRKRVAYFVIGDLSEEEAHERFLVRAGKKPSHRGISFPCNIDYPTVISFSPGEEMADVAFKKLSFKEPLTESEAWKACEEVMQTSVKSKQSYFKSRCFGNLSVTVLDIKSQLESYIAKGWTVDVVILDYADNLMPVNSRDQARDQVNMTWKYLRSIALDFHCLVVTATQTNAAGFNKAILDRSNFSEDNRKLSHVTGFVGINQTDDEKDLGIMRLNWINLRSGPFNPKRCCHVAGCVPLAQPTACSVYPKLNRVKIED